MGQAIGSPAHSQVASVHNPFDDTQSIQTTRTHGSNVIQIALVHPVNQPSTIANPPLSPSRPERSPDLDLEHLAVSQSNSRSDTPTDSLAEPNHRHSYLTSASVGSDFLNEVPMIVTPVRGQVRQVLGVVKAEVIQAPSSPSQQSSLRSSTNSRPPVRSPLANASFGPADVLKEEQDVSINGDPFTDEHTPHLSTGVSSTFGVHGSTASTVSDWIPSPPSQPWSDRPTSVGTQADSIIADIGSATRVNVGLITPMTTPMTIDTPRSLHRMTSARLVSPPNHGNKALGALEQQQQRAFTRFQGSYRDSSGSVLSAASAGEDSILESFPFVPPSPISGIPTRSPRSPVDVSQSSSKSEGLADDADLPPPPDRKMLGMSTGSQISTLSAGLGSFPFQIESSEARDSTSSNLTPNLPGRQRASLDTLALTADLSSYPLGFDKELQDNYPLRKM
jgi:protein OPY2